MKSLRHRRSQLPPPSVCFPPPKPPLPPDVTIIRCRINPGQNPLTPPATIPIFMTCIRDNWGGNPLIALSYSSPAGFFAGPATMIDGTSATAIFGDTPPPADYLLTVTFTYVDGKSASASTLVTVLPTP